MNLSLVKAWKDVVSGRGRSVLVVFALALGIWGLGSVLVSYSILAPDLSQNFLQTRPPHAVVTVPPGTAVDLGANSNSPVEAFEYRDLALLRVEVKPDEWIPLWLFGVRDFNNPQLARILPQSGAFVPPPGTMVMERNARLISNLDTGRNAPVRTTTGLLQVPITGIVFDAAQAPATQDHFVYAYCDQPTWEKITGQVSGQRLLLKFHDVHSAQEVAAAAKGTVLPAGSAVQIPPFEEHPHQWQLNLLMGIITAVGLLAFLLSSVLVSQVVAALLASQTRQVGILKAVGAGRRRIFMLYAGYLGFFAVASTVVALPAGMASGQAFAGFVAGVLNFDVLTRQPPTLVVVVLVVASLVLPFLFAGPTLLRSTRITVKQALSEAPSSRLTQVRVPSWSLRNLARRPGRTLITVAATALGVAIFATGFNVKESLAQFLASTRDAMRFDLQVVLSQPIERDRFLKSVEGVEGIAVHEFWSGGRGELQSRISQTDGGLGVVALPAATALFAPRLEEGRWIRPSVRPEAVLNRLGAEALSARVGDLVKLRLGGQDREVLVVGLAEEIEKAKVYLDQTVWDAWTKSDKQVNTLVLVAQDRSYSGVMALKKRIEHRLVASDLKVLYVMSQAERTKIIADHLDIVLAVLTFLAFLVLGVSALGMASAQAITVRERTREIGILKAVGATPSRVARMLVAEGMWIAGFAVVAGIALSWPLSLLASQFFGTLMLGEGAQLRFAWNPAGLVITTVTTVLMGWLASRVPANAAARISTRKALAYE